MERIALLAVYKFTRNVATNYHKVGIYSGQNGSHVLH